MADAQASGACGREMQEWRNWQTRRLQVPVVARSCGFKSHLLHSFFLLKKDNRTEEIPLPIILLSIQGSCLIFFSRRPPPRTEARLDSAYKNIPVKILKSEILKVISLTFLLSTLKPI